jgi:hypothetical protein
MVLKPRGTTYKWCAAAMVGVLYSGFQCPTARNQGVEARVVFFGPFPVVSGAPFVNEGRGDKHA